MTADKHSTYDADVTDVTYNVLHYVLHYVLHTHKKVVLTLVARSLLTQSSADVNLQNSTVSCPQSHSNLGPVSQKFRNLLGP